MDELITKLLESLIGQLQPAAILLLVGLIVERIDRKAAEKLLREQTLSMAQTVGLASRVLAVQPPPPAAPSQ